jgi:uncharacterized membrane protein YecN with MAPEG domain
MSVEPHTADISFAIAQRGVRNAASFALVLILIVFAAAWQFGAGWPTRPTDAADRLAFAFRCEMATGFVLWAMIARVGAMRYFSSQDIGGVGRNPESVRIAQARAALQNSVEQSLLAIIAHVALALALPSDRMAFVFALICLFVVGRIAFWIGYPKGAAARAFGFALTFYPTIMALLAAFVLTIFDAARI